MTQNFVESPQFPAFYRHDLLTWRREELGLNLRDTARGSGVNRETVRHVFGGNATSKYVYPVAQFLGLDWTQVHNLDLEDSEFHLAVLNGNGSTKELSGEKEGAAHLEGPSL